MRLLCALLCRALGLQQLVQLLTGALCCRGARPPARSCRLKHGPQHGMHCSTCFPTNLPASSLHLTLDRIASPAPSGASAKLESELGEIKGLLAELLRSPSGSRTPRGAGDSASPRASALPAA